MTPLYIKMSGHKNKEFETLIKNFAHINKLRRNIFESKNGKVTHPKIWFWRTCL